MCSAGDREAKFPRIMLAAAASGSGKTLITCGILYALKRRGMDVISFKCGPDYIDPMFHSRVIGTASFNLDTFFARPEVTRYLMMKHGMESDFSVVEGVMGFYDGLAGVSSKASAWDVADVTDTPVVFIVNCKGMSLSVIPYIKGFLEYKGDSHIKGVILNQISPMLYDRMKGQIEQELPVRVCGYVPMVSDVVLESRHLGLVLPDEIPDLRENLEKFADVLEDSIDFDVLFEIGGEAGFLSSDYGQVVEEKCREIRTLTGASDADSEMKLQPIRIGLAKDEAFCFFYEDNLDLLREMGVELVSFSPLHDEKLPENIQGLLLHGGYPELYGRELSENESMRTSIFETLDQGMPCIAECGGFMYLHEVMEDMNGDVYPMVGCIKGHAFRTSKLRRFGYITLQDGRVFGEDIGGMNAHEFHYFDSDQCGESFRAVKPLSDRGWQCVNSNERLLAGFPHYYYHSNLGLPMAFLKRCREYSSK